MSSLTRVPGPQAPSKDRLREALKAYLPTVWRAVQAFGVPSAHAEDVAQHVFLAFSDKLDRVEPGKERAFLLATAVRVAANARRYNQRRPEHATGDFEATGHSDPNPEEALEVKRSRETLDAILQTMPIPQRTVFVLFELEQLSLTEVAEVLGIPRGTVASRLQSARGVFAAAVQRIRSQQPRRSGGRAATATACAETRRGGAT